MENWEEEFKKWYNKVIDETSGLAISPDEIISFISAQIQIAEKRGYEKGAQSQKDFKREEIALSELIKKQDELVIKEMSSIFKLAEKRGYVAGARSQKEIKLENYE